MEEYHLFAWQGFSCEVPVDWNLAEYKMADGVSYARFHDDFSRRLDLEWMYAPRRIRMEVVRRRYDKIASAMRAAGAQAENIEEMPGGWSACLYSMPDGKRLMAAFCLVPESSFFCLLKAHFENGGRRPAGRIIRHLAATFRLYEQGLVPWSVYDIAFQLGKDFRLEATSFQAGRKLLVFEWRLRRLYLMFFSLADLLLKDQTMEKWCANYLNGFKAVSGVKFAEDGQGNLVALHNWWRFWGNIEPVLRGCLRYRAWCRLIPEKNQIFLGVFNHRRQEDIAFMTGSLDPGLTPDSA